MGKFAFLIIFLFVVYFSAIAQDGCRASNGITYTSTAGMSGKFRNSGGMMTIAPTLPAGCYYSALPIPNSCTFTDETTGVLVSTASYECPIDESYALLGFGFLVSLISFRKINSTNRKSSEI